MIFCVTCVDLFKKDNILIKKNKEKKKRESERERER